MTAAAQDLEIVCATRSSATGFKTETPLGTSLDRLNYDTHLKQRIFAENAAGLPDVYNKAIEASDGPDNIAFVHDDVWINDLFLAERIGEALDTFDIIGVAGTRRRLPRQVKFYTTPDSDGRLDRDYVSGRLGQVRPGGPVLALGPAPAPCELLDGVFLAARRSTLKRAGVRFDPQFQFHFYDLDFCRSARQAGLTLGTWPIVITHRSWGEFGDAWLVKSKTYLAKWPD